jgi:hypothetical protein
MANVRLPGWFLVAIVGLVSLVGSAQVAPYVDHFPPPAETQEVREPNVKPDIYFRYYTDVETDPNGPVWKLNTAVYNLHKTESLVFRWPKVDLQAPSWDPVGPVPDDRRSSRPLPGKNATSYRLDSNAPIFFTQSSRKVDAGAYLLAQLPAPSQAASAPPLTSTYSRNRAPHGGKDLTIEITGRVQGGRIVLELKSNLEIDFGLAFSKEASTLAASRPDVKQRAVGSFSKVEELGFPPQFLERNISVVHLPPREPVSFASEPAAWRFESTPIFLIVEPYLVPAGRASIYAPTTN